MLPPAASANRLRLRAGRWVQEQDRAWEQPPAVEQVRQKFLEVATRAAGPDGLQSIPDVLPTMMDFAAAVILQVYTFDYGELEQLLVTDGLVWMTSMLAYAGASEAGTIIAEPTGRDINLRSAGGNSGPGARIVAKIIDPSSMKWESGRVDRTTDAWQRSPPRRQAAPIYEGPAAGRQCSGLTSEFGPD